MSETILNPTQASDADEARNTAIPSKSSGTPQRPAGVRRKTSSCSVETTSRAFLVSA